MAVFCKTSGTELAILKGSTVILRGSTKSSTFKVFRIRPCFDCNLVSKLLAYYFRYGVAKFVPNHARQKHEQNAATSTDTTSISTFNHWFASDRFLPQMHATKA